ncbi:MAG: hemerythrin domain-containing protein [Pseudonocardia sp.]|nr:hemerythrin domain-containing protein [Pseudonocardia sp.]
MPSILWDRPRTSRSGPAPADCTPSSAAHLDWMMAFLHHHTGEDEGLFPLVREHDPAASALLDDMDADHERIVPAMATLERAAAAWAVHADARSEVVAAIDALTATLLPHLRREEDELMPVVARSITQDRWTAWMTGLNAGRSTSDLATEGLWILEGQPPEDAVVMAGLVPPVPRWIILNVLSRGYRKQAFRRWWSTEHSPWKLRPSGGSTVSVAASPSQVWSVLSDVSRIGEWSHECHTARWLDEGGGVGARFVGSNRAGRARRTRTCTVTT